MIRRPAFQSAFFRFPLSVAPVNSRLTLLRKPYATICKSTIVKPAAPSDQTIPSRNGFIPPLIDHHVLLAASKGRCTSLATIIEQYVEVSGVVLNVCLPYEPHPSKARRMTPTSTEGSQGKVRNVVTVAHCAVVGGDHKITLASGFAVDVDMGEEMVIVTCGHTLEEMRQWPLLMSECSSMSEQRRASGSFIILEGPDELEVHPVSRVLSALPRSDLLLVSCPIPSGRLETLPISPYPAQKDAFILTHLVKHQKPVESGWNPWIGDTWGRWVQGKVVGYRDFAGRESQPGTYDSLSHLFFTPLPTPGSSGGPIVDEESGAVVGVILGTRLDNRIEGVKGWGVPSETIFEMFSLPGLEGKK